MFDVGSAEHRYWRVCEGPPLISREGGLSTSDLVCSRHLGDSFHRPVPSPCSQPSTTRCTSVIAVSRLRLCAICPPVWRPRRPRVL